MVLSLDKIRELFGTFTWQEHPTRRGAIIIDPDWVTANIIHVDLAGGWRTWVHKFVAPSLVNAFAELDAKGLSGLIHTFDGCWVARHELWDPRNPLSHHSWGIAFDTDAALFPYNSSRLRDPRLIQIFRDHGFQNGQKGGGLFKNRRDAMHSELVLTNLPGMPGVP